MRRRRPSHEKIKRDLTFKEIERLDKVKKAIPRAQELARRLIRIAEKIEFEWREIVYNTVFTPVERQWENRRDCRPMQEGVLLYI